MSTIGSRIRELRTSRGLLQDKLGQMVGKDRPNISQYETGGSVPPCETLSRLADALGTTTDYLLGRNELDIDDNIRTLTRDIQDLTDGDRDLLKGIIETMRERAKEARDR
jgi:transcriptional regulator with XRE-family HTH domain